MAYTVADLTRAEGHLSKAAAQVSSQRELVQALQAAGHPAGLALDLLEQLEISLEQHREHLETVRRELRLPLIAEFDISDR